MPAHPALNTLNANASPGETHTTSAPMLIAAGSQLNGEICIEGDILVLGHVQGDITARNGDVFVMAGGQVEGRIEARGVMIDGILQGSCTAESLLVRSRGMIDGLVSSILLELEPGGILRGRSEQRPPSPRPAVALGDAPQGSELDWLTSAGTPPGQSPAITPVSVATAWKPAYSWGIAGMAGIALLLASVIAWNQQRPRPTAIQAARPEPGVNAPVQPGSTSAPVSRPALPRQIQPLARPSPPVPYPAARPQAKLASAPGIADKPAIARPPAPETKPGAVSSAAAVIPEPATIATAPATKLMAEGVWLGQLSELQSQQLNLLIKASTRNSNSNQRSPLGPLISKTAQQLMLTRRLQRKYTAQHTVAPYIPSQDSSHFAAGISDTEIRQQYQAKLRALLAQADQSGFHPDSQQLMTSLQQLASR